MAKDDLKVVKGFFSPEGLADLARSGLTADDARSMRLEFKDAEWADENLGEPRAGYMIPYFDFEGGRVADMYRFRFTEFTAPRTFGGKKVEVDQLRYTQPAGTRPYAYFSKRIEWPKAFNEKERRIIFTEGEKKAEAACKAGMLCIGLGGVYAFRSAAREWFFLPELNAIDWTGRQVDICYDSDVMTKKEVHAALIALTDQLVKRGASVNYIYLEPESEDDKLGLDDYLVRHGAAAFLKLPRQQSSQSEAFNKLNQYAGYVTMTGSYWLFEHALIMDEWHARGVLSPLAQLIVPAGKTSPAKEVPAFDQWAKHPSRRTLRGIVYEPGNPRVITVNNDINTWKPPTLRPRRGAVGPWLDLVNFIFRKSEYTRWFLQWLAYPLQVPGTKHYSAVFVHGETQGSGKSFILSPLGDFLYGENFARIENESFESAFNADQANRQLIMIDEIYAPGRADNRISVMSKLKNMITREKNQVNQKHEKVYTVIDYANYYITSNHSDALPLDEDDRRVFVIRAPDAKQDAGWYHDLDSKLRDASNPSKPGPLAQHILHYLLHSIDISDFNPKANALRTEYREEVIRGAYGPVEEFAYRVAHNPEGVIQRHDFTRSLALPETMLQLFYSAYPRSPQVTGQSINLALGRYKELIPKREVRARADTRKYVLYALFDRDVWNKAAPKDWLAYHEVTTQGAFKS